MRASRKAEIAALASAAVAAGLLLSGLTEQEEPSAASNVEASQRQKEAPTTNSVPAPAGTDAIAPGVRRPFHSAGAAVPAAVGGKVTLPSVAHAAYVRAQSRLATELPGCHLSWTMVAGIGKVESNHAQGHGPDSAGTTTTPILGPVLDGSSFAAIPDTDNGRLDQNAQWDRAVGPLQFIPATWQNWGSDGNADGRADPHNIYDAALAAGRYLCFGERDLSKPEDLREALFSYNNSSAYVENVLKWVAYYAGSTVVSASTDGGTVTSSPTATAKPLSTPSAPPSKSTKPSSSTRPTRSPSATSSATASPTTVSPSATASATPSTPPADD